MSEDLTIPDDLALAPLDDGLGDEDRARLADLTDEGEPDAADGPKEDAATIHGLISVPAAQGSIADIRARVMQWAASKVGQRETPPFSNIIFAWADVKPAWQGEPWCAAFVTDAWARQGIDLRKLLSNPYYCPYLESKAKDIGAWRANGSGYTPKAGDLILFGRGLATHVGLSHPGPGSWSGYRTIEGNTSPSNAGSQTNGDGCYVRFRSGSFIRGWIDMDVVHAHMTANGMIERAKTVQSTVAKPVVTPSEPWRGNGRPISFRVYRAGLASKDGGGNVRLVQQMLQRQGKQYAPLVDGRDSPQHRAGVKAWQLAIGDTGSAADGVLGEKQFARLVRWAGWEPVA